MSTIKKVIASILSIEAIVILSLTIALLIKSIVM